MKTNCLRHAVYQFKVKKGPGKWVQLNCLVQVQMTLLIVFFIKGLNFADQISLHDP